MKKKLLVNNQGTPYYAAPEVWRGLSDNGKWDIWSLGWCVYELMALDIPFSSISKDTLYKKIIRGKYDKLPEKHLYSKELI